MDIDLICEDCGRALVSTVSKHGSTVRVEIGPCESCLEAARAEEREKIEKENE